MRWMIPLLAVASVAACSQGGSFAPDYTPLGDGYRWEYAVSYVALFIGKSEGKAVARIEGSETIDGKSYFKAILVYSGIPGAEPETIFMRKGSDGLYQVNGKHTAAGEYLALPLPLEVGKSWTIETPFSSMKCNIDAKESALLFEKTLRAYDV